jgi:adenine-specific DNA-methyltransferase
MTVDKLKIHSPDLTQRNIEAIAELFPTVVAETLDADGNTVRGVDFDALRQELADHIVEGPQERYQLDWPGKRAAAFCANTPVASTLLPVEKDSTDFAKTRNLFVEGDNLDALKLLQESYLGKVKLIYIDPPYNTGTDFIYRDNFLEEKGTYLERSGQQGKDGERLVANSESNGRFRSTWLSMLYPRLKLARNLLRDDGVICVSIDDHELATLTMLMGEVFGRENFIATLPRVTKRAGKSSDLIAANHDYVVIWGRGPGVELNREFHTDPGFKFEDEFMSSRGKYKLNQTLDYGSIQYSPSLDYEIEIDGHLVRPGGASAEEMGERQSRNPRTGWCWRWSRDLFEFGLSNGFVVLKDGRDGPRIYTKTYENALIAKRGHGYEVVLDRRTRTSTTLDLVDNRFSNDMASKNIRKIFGFPAFDYTKPVELLRMLLTWATDADSEDVVMDFFAGSGTTGQAVLEANAEDGGNRRFVLVQLAEATSASSEAFANGFATISELARERLRRTIKRLEQDLSSAGADLGFRALRVSASHLAEVVRSPAELAQVELERFAELVRDGADPLPLLFEQLLRFGIDPAASIKRVVIDGVDVYLVEDAALVACFADRLPLSLFAEVAKLEPLRVVIRDKALSDSARINAQQMLETQSPLADLRTI